MVRCSACNKEGHTRRSKQCILNRQVPIRAEESETEECPICMEAIGDKNQCVLECGHKYHMGCMLTALGRKNACPLCRATVVKEAGSEVIEKLELVSDLSIDRIVRGLRILRLLERR